MATTVILSSDMGEDGLRFPGSSAFREAMVHVLFCSFCTAHDTSALQS